MALPDGPNQRWPLDFIFNALSWGRRFRILCIVDDFTREALALVVETSIGGARMAREFDALIGRRGRPTTIIGDNVLYAEALGGDGPHVSVRQHGCR